MVLQVLVGPEREPAPQVFHPDCHACIEGVLILIVVMVLRTVSVRSRNGGRKNLDLLGVVIADDLGQFWTCRLYS